MAKTDTTREATPIERRREIVRILKFRRGLTDGEIVHELKTRHGITASRPTITRDVELLRREFAAFAGDFRPQIEIAVRSTNYLRIASRAERSASKTTDDGARARLLRVALTARRAEVEMLMNVGLLPRDLGTLHVRPEVPSEKIPSAIELQQLWNSVEVTDAEVTSEAERAWTHGDWAASEDAAKGAKH
jgi:hypothetical protein